MDRIIETSDGFDALVGGKRYGSWRSRAEALGGLEVEKRRQAARAGGLQMQLYNCYGYAIVLSARGDSAMIHKADGEGRPTGDVLHTTDSLGAAQAWALQQVSKAAEHPVR